MDIDEFRKHGHQLIDWMADYMDTVEKLPVRSQVKPGEISNRLKEKPPTNGEPMENIIDEFKTTILPGITHWQHPRFFAYFPANSSPPSVLAEMLTATLGAQCMLWQTSPAATEMETRMMQWLASMIDLPKKFSGVIQDSASSATLCALLTAREKATSWKTNELGFMTIAKKLIVYTSEEAHSSTEKGAKIAGFGKDNIRFIPTDNKFSMCANTLRKEIQSDLDKGFVPTCVVASIGTTGVGAVDPIKKIATLCKEFDIFLHIDAAWAGAAMILPEHRSMADGIELADSIVINPHKWLLTNFDCSAHFVKDPTALTSTLSILPEYLKSKESEDIIDYRDWSIPLGRRFRALKLWFVIRYYGVGGLQKMIRKHIEFASQVEEWIDDSKNFELVAPRSLSLLNFRLLSKQSGKVLDIDKLNLKLLNDLNDSGTTYFTQNRVRGHFAIRWSIGQTNTELRHVKDAWAQIQQTASSIA